MQSKEALPWVPVSCQLSTTPLQRHTNHSHKPIRCEFHYSCLGMLIHLNSYNDRLLPPSICSSSLPYPPPCNYASESKKFDNFPEELPPLGICHLLSTQAACNSFTYFCSWIDVFLGIKRPWEETYPSDSIWSQGTTPSNAGKTDTDPAKKRRDANPISNPHDATSFFVTFDAATGFTKVFSMLLTYLGKQQNTQRKY